MNSGERNVEICIKISKFLTLTIFQKKWNLFFYSFHKHFLLQLKKSNKDKKLFLKKIINKIL